ncbi:flagellar biosynthesis protein FlhF [Bacillus coahuilensis]|uniref:flagellar biosynthesis protein FlhF n=1 Tax=Bacillus coahuilensis TaxID=408580 RepID=UPI00075017DE|nr:flagellar biosynthesis protein FlhF [Bacillus coahuilensis]
MNVKKIIAPTMPEAMKRIRNELGNDAVIINSKVVYTGGFLGMFKKRILRYLQLSILFLVKNVLLLYQKKYVRMPHTSQLPRSQIYPPNLNELKKLVENMSTKSDMTNFEHYPDEVKTVLLQLQAQEFEKEYINRAAIYLTSKWKESSSASIEQVKKWLKDWIVNELQDLPFGKVSYDCQYIQVIGPTGVGKTTTIAKMAAEAVLNDRKKAFITTDTYRIAAIEQLKTYANLLNVPVEVAYKMSDLQLAMEKFSSFDLVFVDTAGRNYLDPQYIKETQELLSAKQSSETLLVLSLTAKEQDLQKIIENFSPFNIDKFIFTKLDETLSYGTIFNLMKKFNKGLAYVTNGQNVPEDITEASIEKLTTILTESVK